MDTIEKIQEYIDQTDVKAPKYGMFLGEVAALREMFTEDAWNAVFLTFNFGMAKGYRAAKAEAKRKKMRGGVNAVKRSGVSDALSRIRTEDKAAFTDPAASFSAASEARV